MSHKHTWAQSKDISHMPMSSLRFPMPLCQKHDNKLNKCSEVEAMQCVGLFNISSWQAQCSTINTAS